jgi:phage terminase small subunit
MARDYNEAREWVVGWRDIVGLTDRMATHQLLVVWVELLDMDRRVRAEGAVITEERANGSTTRKPHPLLAERARMRSQFKLLLGEFGLTPNSRRLILQRDPEEVVDGEDAAWAAFLAAG